jgi:hypothetical protein
MPHNYEKDKGREKNTLLHDLKESGSPEDDGCGADTKGNRG